MNDMRPTISRRAGALKPPGHKGFVKPPAPTQKTPDRAARGFLETYYPACQLRGAIALAGAILRDRRLGRRQKRDRHPVRRAGNVIHPHAVAELHRAGIPAVLAADADFKIRPRLPALLHGPLDEQAHAILVQCAERIGLEDLLLFILLGE